MKITSKYILKEHLGPLTFSLAALTSLLLLNYIARKFGDLVGKGLPWQAIAQFFVLSVPFTIAMTLPMAVLVSTLYAFSRLASENEVTAFKASGVSMGRLLGPVIWGAVAMAITMVVFNDQVLPRANHTLSNLQQDIARTSPTFLLKEQVLNDVTDSFLLRAGHVDQIRHTLREVTIYDMSQQSPRTIRADSGWIGLMPNGRDLQLTLYDGSIEELAEGKPGQLDRTFFTSQLYRLRDVIKSYDPTKPEANAYKSDREMSICELQDSYVRTRTEYLRAKLDLDIAVADSAKRPAPKASPKRRVFLGIGRLYCQGTRALSQLIVRQAKAQGPPTSQPPAAQPPLPDTTRRPATADSTRRPAAPDSTVRPAIVPTPTLPAVPPPTPMPTLVPPGTPPAMQPPSIPPGVSSGAPAPLPVPAGTSPIVPPPGGAGPAVPPPGTAAPGSAVASGVSVGASPIDLARLRLAESLGSMNNYDVEIHKKFALAVACIVFVLLGAPVALRFPRGGVGMVIGVSLFVFASYYSFLIAGEELASRGMLPPWVAMWAANVLFTAVALPLALRMGRETGSGRAGGPSEWIENLRYRLRQRRTRAAVVAPQQP